MFKKENLEKRLNERKPTVYETGLREPQINYYTRTEADQSKLEAKALRKASVDMLFETDISRLTDEGVAALYRSVTGGVWGMEDKDGSFFGKRKSDNMRNNVELLRRFFKGEYRLIEDPEAEEWRKKTWEEKFKYARDRESKLNKVASTLNGERGPTLGEIIVATCATQDLGYNLMKDKDPEGRKLVEKTQRTLHYNGMNDEEKRKYEADVIRDYELKLAKREPLVRYLTMVQDISDLAGYILAKSYAEGKLDVDGLMALEEEERLKVMTTFAQMRGDLKKGRILGIETDFSTGTTGDRFQMGLYGLQQSIVSLGTDLYGLAKDTAIGAWAKIELDAKEREDFYKAYNLIEQAKLYEQQSLPDAQSFGGDAYQVFMENVHWIIPYGSAGKIATKGGKVSKTIAAIDNLADVKKAAKTAALKDMLNVSLFSRLSPMAGGSKYTNETINRLLISVDKYTRELQQLKRMRTAYSAAKGGLDAAWLVARGSAFSSFAQEYIDAATLAGVSREESVWTALWVGLINDRIEHLVIPGLESSLTKAELKSLGFNAMRRSLQEGTFGQYAKNFMSKYITEGLRVGITEGWVEEPLQEIVRRHGIAVDQLAHELTKDGKPLDKRIIPEIKRLLSFSTEDLKTYLLTVEDMLPGSVAFGVTSVPGQLVRRRVRNALGKKLTGLNNYDEGIINLYQREMDVRRSIEEAWRMSDERRRKKDESGEAEGVKGEESEVSQEQKENKREVEVMDALTRARTIYEEDDGQSDIVFRLAEEMRVDVKTAEAVAQLLEEEEETARFDPRARSMVDQFFSGVRINESTIESLLPGYIKGSFQADEERGIYVARVRVGRKSDEGWIKKGQKTIVYRRQDGVFFNPDGTINEVELSKAASLDSSLGVSYDERVRANGNNARTWGELSDAERRREALMVVNGYTGGSGTIAMRRKDGTEVSVAADAIINLATGRLGDIGYGMAARQSTVRHETFHALWKFAKEIVSEEEQKRLASGLGIDTNSEGWSERLDEAMAHQMEEYASGHYVVNSMSTAFERFQAWAAKVFGSMGVNEVKDATSKSRETIVGQMMGEGRSFNLRSFYDAVLAGKLGSGELGIDKIVVSAAAEGAKDEKGGMRKDDELPIEPEKGENGERIPRRAKRGVAEGDALAGVEKGDGEQETGKGEQGKESSHPSSMQRPEWDKGDYVIKRVPKKSYKIHAKLEVVNIFDGIRTSWSEGFDAANQGRDITSDDSHALVEEIAADPDYSKGGRVMEFTGSGAPLVSPTGDVLDGNHHMRGLQLAYERGGEKIERFKAQVLEEAKERGLEVSEHAAEAPIIICRFVSVEVKEGERVPTIAEIAEDTNDTVQRGLNVFETAAKDARILISKNLIPLFQIDPETGLIKDEEEKKSGGAAVNPIGVFRQLSRAQGIVDDDGHITEEGQKRLMNGILAALLGGTNPKVVQAIMEKQIHLDMENEMRALMRLAPELLKLVNDPAKKEYDLRPDILEALTWYQEWRNQDEDARAKAGKNKTEWRKNKSRPTAWVNYKGDMFSKPGPAASILGDLFAASQELRSFQSDGESDTKAGRKRAQDLIIKEIEAYLKNVYATNTDTADLLGDFTPPTKDEILTTQREKSGSYSVSLWHGSAADFNTPDLSYLGSGTGFAAQGNGFYLTDKRNDAEYWGHVAAGYGYFAPAHNSIIAKLGKFFSPVYLYQFKYDGDEMSFIDSQGPNPDAAQRVQEIVAMMGWKAPENFFRDETRTTGIRIETYLKLVAKEDGESLTKLEMADVMIRAGIDGTKEYAGEVLGNIFVVYNTGKLTSLHKWRNGKQMYSIGMKKYVPRPATQEEFDFVEKRFGTTSDYTHAQWLLPSGKVPTPVMIKGGIGEFPSHEGLINLIAREDNESNLGSYLDVLGGGAVRIKSGEGIEVARRPTEAQFDTLYDVIERNKELAEDSGEESIYVDVDNEVGETLFTASYTLKTSTGKILSDLKAWYDKGVMPESGASVYTNDKYSTARRKPLKSARDIADYSYEYIFNQRGFDLFNKLDNQISVWAIQLDNRDIPMGAPKPVFLGTADHITMHPREILKTAIRWGAPKVAFVRTDPITSSAYENHYEQKHVNWIKEAAKLLDIKFHSWTVLRSDGAFRDVNKEPFDYAAPSRGWFMPPKGNSKKARLFFPDAGYEVESLVDWDEYTSLDNSRFSIGARKRAEYSRLISKHRPDLEESKIEKILDIINEYENTKKEKLAVHWTITGAIILPQDEFKIDKAIFTSERAKVDPFKFKNPEDIFIQFPQHLPKEKPIDPDTVSALSNKTILPNGLVVYDVDETEEITDEAKALLDSGVSEQYLEVELGTIRRPVGQLAMREIINTHWGKDASPWCLLQGDGNGNLTKHSYQYWHHYAAIPKKVAFRNGKLLAFMATDASDMSLEQADKWDQFFEPWRDEYYNAHTGLNEINWLRHTHPEVDLSKILPSVVAEEWWDREDKSHEGIPVTGVIPGDELGRMGVSEYINGIWRSVGKLWKGNRTNGKYEEWSSPEQRCEVSNWKNGKLEGDYWTWWSHGGVRSYAKYKSGKPVGDMVIYDMEGRISRREKYDENGKMIGPTLHFWDNSISLYREYVDDERVKRILSFFEDGEISSYCLYGEDREHYELSVDFQPGVSYPNKVFFREGDKRYRVRFSAEKISTVTIGDDNGGGVEISYHDSGRITKIMETDSNGDIVNFKSWWHDENGNWSQALGLFDDKTTFRFSPDGKAVGIGRVATEEESNRKPEPMVTNEELERMYPAIKGLEGMIKSRLAQVERERQEVIEKAEKERSGIDLPKFSVRLHRAKRDSVLLPKSAIAQMELDLYAERSEIKNERKKKMVEEADKYTNFIKDYRPIMEDAFLRGNWKAALDFAEKHSMPIASNILKDYYREPEFNTTELIGLSVKSIEDAAAILMTARSPFIESTKAIYLDRRRRILDAKILTIGQIGQAMIRKGTVLRHMPAKTAYVIFSHNHPSGVPSPSKPDKALTTSIKHELKAVGVKLLDHIITDGTKYYSFNYQSTMDAPENVVQPQWEVISGISQKTRSFRDISQVKDLINNFLRDDGESGHVIYLNTHNVSIGVRRIPAYEKFGGTLEEWVNIATLGAEDSAGVSVLIDIGPGQYVPSKVKKIIKAISPAFAVRGVTLMDAFFEFDTEIRSARGCLSSEWESLAKNEYPETTEDLFNYPKYSIASRKLDWDTLPASLEKVVTSTSVQHLTGQDKEPEKYELFKFYRDRYMLDEARPMVDRWLKKEESKWLAKYLLAKYYGDIENALEVVKHRFSRNRIPVLKDFVDFTKPVKWVYVRNDDGKRTNRLPEAYAILLADAFGGEVETGIMKVSDERNTGATLKERVSREFQFAGKVEKNMQYVIVDDVWTTGQTTVSLMEYIIKEGGVVPAVTTLATAANGARIKPTERLLQRVIEKGRINSVESANKFLGIDLRKATGSELQAYIVKGTKGVFGIQDWFSNAAPSLALDFASKGVARRGEGDSKAPSGIASNRDLFGHLSKEERRKVTTKPTQGAFQFSTSFPRLSEMDDDSLIAAALASRLALDKKERMNNALKFDTVMKMVKKAHPTMSGDELRSRALAVQGETLKIARNIRSGLDKGVSESAILKALNDSLKPKFMSEMRREGREGAKVGAFGAKAEAMFERRTAEVMDEAVRVEAGIESDVFEAWAGVDFTETLLNALHNKFTDERGVLGKKTKKEDEEEADSTSSATGAEGEEEKKKKSLNVETMENPKVFAEYIRDLAAKYWREKHGLPEGANPWMNRLAIQFLRKTAANIYKKLVKSIMYSQSRDTAFKQILKLENIPTERGILSQMTYIGEIIHARHIREKREELCKKLEQLLKKEFGATGRFKPDKEELKRKVTAEAELRARYMLHAMWLTPEAASNEASELSRELTSMALEYEEAGRELEQSRIYVETIRKLSILREFGALKYKTPGEIESALRYWEELAQGARDKVLEAMEEREGRTKAAAAVFAKAFFNPRSSHAVEKGFNQALGNYLMGHMGFASLLEDMMRFSAEGDKAQALELVNYLMREIQKAGDRSASEMRRHGGDFHEAVEKIYRMSFKKVMSEMNREDLRFEKFMGLKGGKRVMPTKGRAMQLLVSLLQGEKEGSHYFENVKKWGRKGQASEIARLLSAEDMNLINWLGKWYEVNRKELSDISESLFGIGVYSEVANYFPVKMLLEKQGLEKVEGVSWTIFPKALTPRVFNLRDFDTSQDIFAIWASRMEEAAQWKGHAKLGLELRGIFGRSMLQETIVASHGARANQLVLGFITDILSGHGAYDRTTNGIEWVSDQIRGWTALCALGGNVGVTFKQTTSIPAFGFEIGLVKTARYVVEAFTPAGMEAMKKLFASEQRKTRWQVGNTEAVKNALAKNDAGWFKRFMQASMITNKIGDLVPGLVVGQGIYRDCIARGMSEENAMAETWMIIERTQQSGRMENQTSVQRRNRLGRMMYQFLTTQQQYLQYEVKAIRAMIADPSLKNAGKVANTVILNHFILSSLYYWMGELYKAMLGSEPPEDQIADWVVGCLLGPYNSLFVLGFCCKATLDRFLKGSWAASRNDMVPMESFVKRTIGDSARVMEAVFDEERTTDELIDAIADLAAGLNPIVRDARRVSENLEEDDE